MDSIFIIYSIDVDSYNSISYHKTLEGAIAAIPKDYLKHERTPIFDYGWVKDYTYYAIKEAKLLD